MYKIKPDKVYETDLFHYPFFYHLIDFRIYVYLIKSLDHNLGTHRPGVESYGVGLSCDKVNGNPYGNGTT